MKTPSNRNLKGDLSFRERENHRRRREWLWQAIVVVMVLGIVFIFGQNIHDNLQARDIRSGFAFLKDHASFEIGESLISVSATDSFARMFFAGMLNTIRVAFLSIVTATILGVIVGLMRLSSHPLIKFLGAAHVEFYRNIPLLIQLFAIYLVITEFLPDSFDPFTLGSWLMISKAGIQFAVPNNLLIVNSLTLLSALLVGTLIRNYYAQRITGLMATLLSLFGASVTAVIMWMLCGFIFGWSTPQMQGFMLVGGAGATPEFLTLWLGLTTFTSASIAEIVRAGVLAVPKNQWRAAEALGMTRLQTINYIVLPQSLRLAIPPLASQFMNLTKNSSLAVIIGYPDIVSVGNTSIVIMGQALEAIVIIMAVYLFLNLVIAILMNAMNSRITVSLK